MALPKCILTGVPITDANNSRAHVVPSALGGRLKPWGILTREANTLLGDNIDLPLIRAFQSLMSLLDGSRDSGRNQPVRMTDGSGRELVFAFGEPLKLARPEYEETEGEGTLTYRIDARNIKELKTLLGRVRAKHPAFDVDDAVARAIAVRVWPDGVLHHRLQIGPKVVFPAVYVAASVFAAYHGLAPHPDLPAFARSFDPDAPTLPPDTFFFMPGRRWTSVPGEVTHSVILLADASRGSALVCVDLFKIMTVGVVLPYASAADRVERYAVDVLTGKEVRAVVDRSALDGVPWSATHQNGDADLLDRMQSSASRIAATAMQRATAAQASRIVADTLGDTPTFEKLLKTVAAIADFTLHGWERPLTTAEDREAGLETFDAMCRELGHIQMRGSVLGFHADVQAERAKLVAAIDRAREAPLSS